MRSRSLAAKLPAQTARFTPIVVVVRDCTSVFSWADAPEMTKPMHRKQRSERSRRNGSRALGIERLETRQLLTGSLGTPLDVPAHNSEIPLDVNGDGQISASDAISVVSYLNRNAARSRPDGGIVTGAGEASSNIALQLFYDVSEDQAVSAVDALMVVNYLNAEGEPPGQQPSQLDPATLPPAAAAPEIDAAQISTTEVTTLLERAAAASASETAIIAVVDRGGTILGVRVEEAVLTAIADEPTLVFAIDGAVAKARTAAYFAHNQAPLTSRTIRNISQSTVTQRAVESNPNIADIDSRERGPGTVGPIGLGGHFPAGIRFTPPVDLFDIENTNRDSLVHPGEDTIKGTDDDALLPQRFNIDPEHLADDVNLPAPESYGFQSGRMVFAQARGIATLPGGIPLYKDGMLVGGIGVFFPGPDGYATHEQGFTALPLNPSESAVFEAERVRTNAAQVLESEWIAFAAMGGSSAAGASVGSLDGIDPLDGFDLPFGRLDLGGITLEVVGPNPTTAQPISGVETIRRKGVEVGVGDHTSGADQPIAPNGDLYRQGEAIPTGWLVTPQAAGLLSASDVERIIEQSIEEANRVRAGIRLPIGSRTRMVFAVADKDGNILGLYRMEDATYFSVAVAVAKARNTAYYADANALLDIDNVGDLPKDTSFTNRTFRFLSEARFPDGVEGSAPPPFSILNDGVDAENRINPSSAENIGDPLRASDFTSVLGYNTFHTGQNFRDASNHFNQNGIVFFPGSSSLYQSEILVGGFGVSGDGVDQDDVVTFAGSDGFQTPNRFRADRFFVGGVRLPYQKFLRNPRG